MHRGRPLLERAGHASTLQVALVTAGVFWLLGTLLHDHIGNTIEERALASAIDTAAVAAELGVRPLISAEKLDRGLSAIEMQQIDQALSSTDEDSVRRLKIFNANGEIVYSDDRRQVGRVDDGYGPVAAALTGEIRSKFAPVDSRHANEAGLGQLVEVFVPLRYEGEIAGVAEVYLPYDRTASAVQADRRRVSGILVAALAIAWVGLLPIVRLAENRLRRSSEDNRVLALHDPLTGLPNRARAIQILDERLPRATASSGVALAILDLDRFKEVNDSLGHHWGDRLLQQVARRLAGAIGPDEFVARLGGDEFVVILTCVGSANAATCRMTELLEVLWPEMTLDAVSVLVEASAGLAMDFSGEAAPDELMRQADIAMYAAKGGHQAVVPFDPSLDEGLSDRILIASDLRRAITGGCGDEFWVAYQPKVSLSSGHVTSVEALARWTHPRFGAIGPDTFVPVAESTGLIRDLTEAILRRAVADCRDWQHDGLEFGVAVNLSPVLLRNDGIVQIVSRALQDFGLPPDQLMLEITEDTLMDDTREALAVLERLHGLGIGVSIDDFGTGHSSLSYLHRLPANEMKIDRSFVSGVGLDDRNRAAIVRAAVEIAKQLNLTVVAEGVECQEDLSVLFELGCDTAQGFHISRPVPVEELRHWAVSEHRLAGLDVGALTAVTLIAEER